MRTKLTVFILTLVVALSVFGIANGYFFGQTVVATGTINLYGHPAERGLAIDAYIGQEKVAHATTDAGGKFELHIPQYDPSHPEIKGYKTTDDVILVKLDGKEAKPTFSPDKPTVKITLDVEQSLDVQLSTWGKIKALFK